MNTYYLRKARIQDVKTIHGMLMDCARNELLLPRSFNELFSHLRDFYVLAESESNLAIGCCALSITWDNLAEIRSLVVSPDHQMHGHGKRLVEACLSEAVTLGVYKVFTLTYQRAFFEKMGFVEVTKDELPQKVWADCIRCPKFPECDEIAMVMEM
ncbi:N-acetyltransferase [Fundidesulfovibrio butyratiphilus]